MARPALSPARSASCALACALELVLAACGGKDPTASGPGSSAQTPPPGQTQPPPTPTPSPPSPPPAVTADSLAGTYVLTRINDSKPGQTVTLSNPDGQVIGLYRFETNTRLELEVPEHFDIEFHFSDDKGDYTFDDHGRYQAATPPGTQLGLTFTSEGMGTKFTGAGDDSSVGIAYDTDGDGTLDTFFFFERVAN